jgi:hypothetical protein
MCGPETEILEYDIFFLLDVSGSMGGGSVTGNDDLMSGSRLDRCKTMIKFFIDSLDEKKQNIYNNI